MLDALSQIASNTDELRKKEASIYIDLNKKAESETNNKEEDSGTELAVPLFLALNQSTKNPKGIGASTGSANGGGRGANAASIASGD